MKRGPRRGDAVLGSAMGAGDDALPLLPTRLVDLQLGLEIGLRWRGVCALHRVSKRRSAPDAEVGSRKIRVPALRTTVQDLRAAESTELCVLRNGLSALIAFRHVSA